MNNYCIQGFIQDFRFGGETQHLGEVCAGVVRGWTHLALAWRLVLVTIHPRALPGVCDRGQSRRAEGAGRRDGITEGRAQAATRSAGTAAGRPAAAGAGPERRSVTECLPRLGGSGGMFPQENF